jgi:hypothetical protein
VAQRRQSWGQPGGGGNGATAPHFEDWQIFLPFTCFSHYRTTPLTSYPRVFRPLRESWRWLWGRASSSSPQSRYPSSVKRSRSSLPLAVGTRAAIDEAKPSGQQVRAINKANGNAATRYVHPETGQSVVIDDVTGEVIHVGGPGFKDGPASGDLP